MRNLGARIREARGRAGLTQVQLAEKLGVSKATVSRWETDEDVPRGQRLIRVGRVLGLPADWFSEESEIPADRVAEPGLDQNAMIPVFGFGSAGEGIDVDDHGYPVGQSDFWVPRSIDNRDPHAYATRVTGRSMAPYLEEGDLVEVRTDVEVKQGNIAVVIHHDGRKWIKRVELLPKKRGIRCVPLNPHEEPFELGYDELSRLHRVVGMKRKGMY